LDLEAMIAEIRVDAVAAETKKYAKKIRIGHEMAAVLTPGSPDFLDVFVTVASELEDVENLRDKFDADLTSVGSDNRAKVFNGRQTHG
jgi:hypothetical protein